MPNAESGKVWWGRRRALAIGGVLAASVVMLLCLVLRSKRTNDGTATGPPTAAALASASASISAAPSNASSKASSNASSPPSAHDGGEVHAAVLDHAASLAASGDRTCALRDDGSVWCWGGGDAEDGPTYSGPRSMPGDFSPARIVLPGRALALFGGAGLCARVEGGDVHCWTTGRDVHLEAAMHGALLISWPCFVAGGRVTCDGHVVHFEKTEDADDASALDPADGLDAQGDVAASSGPPLSDVVDLGMGESFGCARTGAHLVNCFTRKDWLAYRALGDDASGAPQQAVDLRVGAHHACARIERGGVLSVTCWGDHRYGQVTGARPCPHESSLGIGTPLTGCGDEGPGEVARANGAKMLAIGDWHTCALLPNRLTCWGLNSYGQLGVEPPPHETMTFDLGDGLGSHATRRLGRGDYGRIVDASLVGIEASSIHAVVAGRLHTCVLFGADGQVACFGSDWQGQLGGCDTEDLSATPVVVKECPGVGVESESSAP